MVDNRYLEVPVYHMTSFNNLQSIFHKCALLSKEKVLSEKIAYHSVANEDVQSLRERICIWDFVQNRFRSLHSYVPFYFAKFTPMLYRQYKDGLQDEIVFLDASRS